MALWVKVTADDFRIGKNAYERGRVLSLSDELAKKHSDSVEPTKAPKAVKPPKEEA